MVDSPPQPAILTIAGSDSSGGAGIQADLRTFAALGCYGASAITALTAQNTIGVQGVHAILASFVSSQLTSVLSDVEILAMKTGMLFDASIIQAVTGSLKTQYEGQKRPPLVCDPVCVSTSGHTLLQSDAIGVLISDLFPMSTLITPNKSEAELLLGHKHGPYTISSLEDMIVAARRLLEFGSSASLVKGGHVTVTLQEIEKVAADSMDIVVYRDGMMEDNMEILQVDWTAPPRLVVDVLCEDNSQTVSLFVRPYIDSKNTHGTGCTLSAAIAARLGNGDTLVKAVRAATIYTHLGLEAALPIGQGHGPLNHLHSNLQLSLPRQTPSNPYPFARYLIHRSRKIWKQYVEHDFVRLLGKGVLRREAFVFFIKQDYHYLKYYARAYGLMAGKATKYRVIESSASIIFNIVNETATHKSLCADFGVSAEELEATPLAQSTISYGSYLIDVAVQGDVAQLSMAVLACLLGYGEVGLWLKKESLKPDSWVQLTGNPYLRWIEDYSGEAYQNAVKSGLAAIEAQASHDPPSPARLEEWYDVWERCAWLEKGFWDAAMAIVPSE